MREHEDLTCGLVSALTTLREGDAGIESLAGIQNLTSLTYLGVPGNSISDTGELSGLKDLNTLNLRDNSITDISPLGGLTGLMDVRLPNNAITDISGLSGLSSLSFLNLRDNQITDINTLSQLTSLTSLWLDTNAITDINTVSGLTGLTVLNLNDDSITDVNPVSTLTDLRSLRLDRNSISDISPLSRLTVPAAGCGDRRRCRVPAPRRGDGAVSAGGGVLRFTGGVTSTWHSGFDSAALVADVRISGTSGVLYMDNFVFDNGDGSAGFTARGPALGQQTINVPSAKRAPVLMFEDLAAAATDRALRDQWMTATERTQTLLDLIWRAGLESERSGR